MSKLSDKDIIFTTDVEKVRLTDGYQDGNHENADRAERNAAVAILRGILAANKEMGDMGLMLADATRFLDELGTREYDVVTRNDCDLIIQKITSDIIGAVDAIVDSITSIDDPLTKEGVKYICMTHMSRSLRVDELLGDDNG